MDTGQEQCETWTELGEQGGRLKSMALTRQDSARSDERDID